MIKCLTRTNISVIMSLASKKGKEGTQNVENLNYTDLLASYTRNHVNNLSNVS